jgi:hypothetical protein
MTKEKNVEIIFHSYEKSYDRIQEKNRWHAERLKSKPPIDEQQAEIDKQKAEREMLALKSLQNDHDDAIVKKLQAIEYLDDGEKAEIVSRFKNHPEILKELTQLRQENSELHGKKRKAYSILYGFARNLPECFRMGSGSKWAARGYERADNFHASEYTNRDGKKSFSFVLNWPGIIGFSESS